MKASVRSSMEVVELGKTEGGVPVYMDRLAGEADSVVLVGRIKPHTSFSSEVESGLSKMAAIGLGKHEQALLLHAEGVRGIRDHMVEIAEKVYASGKILFGVGVVENAYKETAVIEAIPVERILEREKELLQEAKRLMPKLPVSEIDVLFVDEIGKNYSGTGMDTNIVGRLRIPGVEEPPSPNIRYIVAGDLGQKSGCNVLGIADLTTRRLFEKIDLDATNKNVLTSTFLEWAKIPMVLKNDREALEAAVRCNWGTVPEDTRFVCISNTLELRHVYLSENLVEEALEGGNVEIVEEAAGMGFTGDGNFASFDE